MLGRDAQATMCIPVRFDVALTVANAASPVIRGRPLPEKSSWRVK